MVLKVAQSLGRTCSRQILRRGAEQRADLADPNRGQSRVRQGRQPNGDIHAFAEAVDRVSTLSSDKGRAVKLSITDGKLTLSVNNPDSGSASEELPVEYGFDPLEIGFNPEFLKEGIESVSGDEVMVRLISPLRPGLLEPVEGDDFRYLVMPIRLNV